MSKHVIDQLGDSLWSPSTNETVNPRDVLTDKLILLYFSASFCGPCRRFTPTLKEFYSSNQTGEDFEVVFLSMDKSQKDYETYTSDMPWYALPFTENNKQLTKALAARYGVQGIPHLVIFDKDGSMLQQDAVSLLMDNPEAFPWRPKPLAEALPNYYLLPDGSTLEEIATLKQKYVMLYFSAHWCLPCRQFSPNLAKAYAKLKELREDFEVRNRNGVCSVFARITRLL
jgi:nucleoredoxin